MLVSVWFSLEKNTEGCVISLTFELGQAFDSRWVSNAGLVRNTQTCASNGLFVAGTLFWRVDKVLDPVLYHLFTLVGIGVAF